MDSQLLHGDSRYAQTTIAPLESLVRSGYNLEASLALLKLYQLFPASLKLDVVEHLLVHALAEGDFHVCSFVLTAAVRNEERVAKVFALAQALESADYKQFWALLAAGGYAKAVPSLEPRARQVVLEVVGLTYGRIDKSLLQTLVNASQEDVEKLVAGREGWKIEGDVVVLPPRVKSSLQQELNIATQEQRAIVLGLTKHNK